MGPNVYDPAKRAGSENYNQYHDQVEYGMADALGPAGTTTNIEHDEKGILETGVFEAMGMHQRAALSSDHDSFRRGIYATTSLGDND